MAIEVLLFSQRDAHPHTQKWQSVHMLLDDLMAWIILQVHWENANVGRAIRASSPWPASSRSLPAKGRRQTVLPPLVFCWVQRKGSGVWRRPSPGGHYAGGNTAGRGVAGSLLVSLSTKAQRVCRAGHVKPGVSTGVLPLSKNLISTFKISPSSSLPFIRIQTFSWDWGASHKFHSHGQVRLWL